MYYIIASTWCRHNWKSQTTWDQSFLISRAESLGLGIGSYILSAEHTGVERKCCHKVEIIHQETEKILGCPEHSAGFMKSAPFLFYFLFIFWSEAMKMFTKVYWGEICEKCNFYGKDLESLHFRNRRIPWPVDFSTCGPWSCFRNRELLETEQKWCDGTYKHFQIKRISVVVFFFIRFSKGSMACKRLRTNTRDCNLTLPPVTKILSTRALTNSVTHTLDFTVVATSLFWGRCSMVILSKHLEVLIWNWTVLP